MIRPVISCGVALVLLASCGNDQRVESDSPVSASDASTAPVESVASATSSGADSSDPDRQISEGPAENLSGSLIIVGSDVAATGCRVVTDSLPPACSGGWSVRLSVTREDLLAAGVEVSDVDKEAGLWMSATRVEVTVAPPFTFEPGLGLAVGSVVEIAPDKDSDDPYKPQESFEGTGDLAPGGGDSEDVEKARIDLQYALSPDGTLFIVDNETHFLVVTMLPLTGKARQLLVDSLKGEIQVTVLLTQ
ncbi:MAG TPA: hypothetical protein PK020_13785 [Ilumatobacteraceae bacterium]|nr:hypothetical protein [Ilumatobacteraceae bacterium]